MIGIVHNNRMDLSEEADVELLSTNSLFSTGVNQIPMPSTVQGPRHLYGNKFFEQALPMKNREAPLVRNMEDHSGRSWDWKIGEQLGAIRAGEDEDQATVDLVDADRIVLKLANGEKREKELYNHFPGNRKTLTHSYTKLQKGDVVNAGQTLASSNFTDDEGRMALGLNARIAVVPYKGFSMDDAVVISQSLADRLTSMHAEAIDREPDDDMTLGKQHFVALFPDKFKQEQLDKLDDQGLPLPGARLEPGDPMILQTRPRQFSSANTDVARLSRNKRFVRKDAAVVWEGDYPADVLDVVKTREGGNRILVAYEAGVNPADKLVLRPGQKMTVSLILPDDKMPKSEDGRPVEMLMNQLGLPCFDDQTEFLTRRGWLKGEALRESDVFATLNKDNLHMEFQEAEELIVRDYEGPMYCKVTQQLDILVTPNHRQLSFRRGLNWTYRRNDLTDPRLREALTLDEAKDIVGQPRKYLKAALWKGEKRDNFTVPGGSRKPGQSGPHSQSLTFKMEHWVQFMGWFLSEGYTSLQKNRSGYRYCSAICQSKKANPEKFKEIKALLDEMGLRYLVDKAEKTFLFFKKSLYEHLAQFGKCRTKFIPSEILDACPEQLQMFLNAIMKGDGNCYTNLDTGHIDTRSYTTASRALADGIQEVGAKLGIVVNIKRENRRGDDACYYMALQKTGPTTAVNFNEKQVRNEVEEWVDYRGKVYCVTVPNGILFVRRNGKAVFSGNSRENAESFYEMMLGKIARKTGKPYTLPQFLPKGKNWWQFVKDEMDKHGVTDAERLYDPGEDRFLDNPVTIGDAFVMKLHHQAAKKMTARGQAGYDLNMQPLKGQGQGAQRLSGLEMTVLQSSGARGVQKESILLKGTKNDDYWQALRQNRQPGKLGRPFVFDKFLTLLQGAGVNPADLGKGKLRLTPMTRKILDELEPTEIKSGDLIDLKTFEPKKGGLFDPALVREGKWGYVQLKKPVVNPSYEETVRILLGLTKDEYEKLLDEP